MALAARRSQPEQDFGLPLSGPALMLQCTTPDRRRCGRAPRSGFPSGLPRVPPAARHTPPCRQIFDSPDKFCDKVPCCYWFCASSFLHLGTASAAQASTRRGIPYSLIPKSSSRTNANKTWKQNLQALMCFHRSRCLPCCGGSSAERCNKSQAFPSFHSKPGPTGGLHEKKQAMTHSYHRPITVPPRKARKG